MHEDRVNQGERNECQSSFIFWKRSDYSTFLHKENIDDPSSLILSCVKPLYTPHSTLYVPLIALCPSDHSTGMQVIAPVDSV